MKLQHKTVLVTGASKGIGRALSLGMAREGADVIANYHTDRDGANSTVEEIRKLGREEWYVSTAARRDFVYEIFERQCEICLENLEKIQDVVKDQITAIWVTGTDFGQQGGPFISPETYRQLYKPFHKRVNDWIHKHTAWKAVVHSCGSVRALIEDFIDAGFDILNPLQCSAAQMNPSELKKDYGDQLTFWGGWRGYPAHASLWVAG